MKDVAEFLRFMTPSLTDMQRYTYLSQFHLYSQLLLVCIFFMSNSFFSKLIILTIIFCCIYIEILYRECPITILEREFYNETWDDILDVVFKKAGWDITRSEKIVGFTCFNIGILLSFSMFTIYSLV